VNGHGKIERLASLSMALFSAITPFIADLNETHIYNPHWPPHAKFHNAQVLVFTLLLNSAALYFIWRKDGIPQDNLLTTTLLIAAYWVSLGLSILFPDTAWHDPGSSATPYILGIPGNAFAFLIFTPVIAFASWLGFRHLRRNSPI